MDSRLLNEKVSQEMFDGIIREVVEEIGVPGESLVTWQLNFFSFFVALE